MIWRQIAFSRPWADLYHAIKLQDSFCPAELGLIQEGIQNILQIEIFFNSLHDFRSQSSAYLCKCTEHISSKIITNQEK